MSIVTDLDYLRQPCKEVTPLFKLAACVAKLNWEFKHVSASGLAANQIHIQYRVCLIGHGTMNITILVNPIVIKEEDFRIVKECCLSLPGLGPIEVRRPWYIKVRAFDEDMRKVKLTFTREQAQVVKHEIDHLDGKLLTDYLPEEERVRAEAYLQNNKV